MPELLQAKRITFAERRGPKPGEYMHFTLAQCGQDNVVSFEMRISIVCQP